MRTFAVFVHSDEIKASSATIAIKRYMKLHPGADEDQVKAVNVIAIKTLKQTEVTYVKEQGVVITETPRPAVGPIMACDPEDSKPENKEA